MNDRRGKTAKLRYILSAGRTGTVFLEGLINRQFGQGSAVHEPSPTRYQMMLANLRNDWHVGAGLLDIAFRRSRDRRVAKAPSPYIEINPFLCAMTDLLPAAGKDLLVVHLVREPGDWAASMSSFKASTRFRGVIDYIPFAKPYPSPRPSGWRNMPDIERALWRWRWCNSRIGDLESQCTKYVRVRYEDIFSSDPHSVERVLRSISASLDLPDALKFDPNDLLIRANPSDRGVKRPEKAIVDDICGDLASQYGY